MGTATSVLECKQKYNWLPEVNCTIGSVKYGEFASNPSITGVGTDLSFVLTAGLSLLSSSAIQLICDRLHIQSPRAFFEVLVTSFSDQQLVRGLSLSFATLYTPTACQIDAYRYDILCYLILMTIVSHLSSILVLKSYVRGALVLEALRFGLVFAQVCFAGLVLSARETNVFPTGIPNADDVRNTTLVLPAVCFQRENVMPYQGLQDIPHAAHKDISAFSSYIIIAVFYAITVVYAIVHILTHLFASGTGWEVRQKEERARRWSWFWWLGITRGMILLGAWIIWIWAVAKLYILRNWMMWSGWMSKQSHMGDDSWTFGDFLNMSLLGAAVLSVVNAWNGVKQNREDEEGRKSSLFNLRKGPYESASEFQLLRDDRSGSLYSRRSSRGYY